MIKNVLVKIIKILIETCRANNGRIVLMGGIAVSFYIRPRATYDIDAIIHIDKEDLNRFLREIYKKGFNYDKRHPIKHIQNLSFIPLYFKKNKIYVDLFVAENEYQKEIISRAKRIKIGSRNVNLISPEDLILLKLLSGRQKDTDDVRNIICDNLRKLDFKYINSWAERLNVRVFLKDELKSLGLENKMK